ncbi:MAG: DNA-3-methyladenine glycosylase I [Prevotella sp.]|jgi:DNA-3-methyladenine glycosylase I|nr:DNA-3-methyladenine glycosylase I [Prevotella sp.]
MMSAEPESALTPEEEKLRSECAAWGKGDPLAISYHDTRWCRPVHDDTELFAMLCLEGQQAGLSWLTILRKEKEYRRVFHGFSPDAILGMTEDELSAAMQNPGIIRNRQKVMAVVRNAKALRALLEGGEFRSFDSYVWHFTEGRRVVHHPRALSDIPAEDGLSRKVSADLRRRGFVFCGPVIVYSFLQAIGVTDDHLEGCPCKILTEEP